MPVQVFPYTPLSSTWLELQPIYTSNNTVNITNFFLFSYIVIHTTYRFRHFVAALIYYGRRYIYIRLASLGIKNYIFFKPSENA